MYSASKFAVRGLTEALNIECAADGVWGSDVMVAYVQTPMVADAGVAAQMDALSWEQRRALVQQITGF